MWMSRFNVLGMYYGSSFYSTKTENNIILSVYGFQPTEIKDDSWFENYFIIKSISPALKYFLPIYGLIYIYYVLLGHQIVHVIYNAVIFVKCDI